MPWRHLFSLLGTIDGHAYKFGTLSYIDTDVCFILHETQVTFSVDSIHYSARGPNTCGLVSGDLVKD